MLKEGIPILAGLVALVAGWMDWRSRRIPNWLTVPGAILGLAGNTAAQGWPGMKLSLEGLGLGLLLLLPLVLVRALGAGDWKLVGAIGAILGPHDLLLVLAAALLIAGVMALALVIYKKRLVQTLRNIGSLLVSLLTGRPGERAISLDNPETLKVPFGVAVALAVIVFVGQKLAVSFSG